MVRQRKFLECGQFKADKLTSGNLQPALFFVKYNSETQKNDLLVTWNASKCVAELENNTWYTIKVVCDFSTKKYVFFVDDVQVDSRSMVSNNDIDAAKIYNMLRFKAFDNKNAVKTNFMLDDIKVYEIPMSAAK